MLVKKGIFILLLSLSFGFVKAQDAQINWMSFEEALAAQKKAPKKIMMDVYTNWCGPCKLLDKRTFANKDLVNYVNKHFYAVKFNGEGNEVVNYQGKEFSNPNYDASRANTRNSSHQLTSHFQVRGFPSILFFEEGGELLAPLPGFRTAKQLEVFLKLFQSNAYKEISSEEQFNAYQNNFTYEFSE